MTAEAKIRVKLDGTSDVLTGVEKVRGKFQDLEKAAKGTDLGRNFAAAGKMAGDLGVSLSAIVGAADRASRSVLGITDIDVTGAKRRYGEIEQSVTRLAMKSGQSVAEMKQQIRDLAQTRHVAEREVVESVQRVSEQTGSSNAARFITDVALEQKNKTGSAEGVERFGVKAYNNLGVQSPQALREAVRFTSAAGAAYGTSGGRGGLMNLIGGMDLSKVYTPTDESRQKLLTLIARTAGNLPPELAAQKAQNLINSATGIDDLTLIRTLGGGGYIEKGTGRRDVVEVLTRLSKKYGKRFPAEFSRVGAQINELGGGAFGAGYSMSELRPQSVAEDTAEIQGMLNYRAPLAPGARPPTAEELQRESSTHQSEAERRARANRPAFQRALQEELGRPAGAQRYDQTAAGRRQQLEAERENFETNEVGGRAQQTQDAYDEAFRGRPGARMLMENTVGRIPGAATAAAAAAAAASGVLKVELTPQSARDVGREVSRAQRPAAPRPRPAGSN